MTTVTTVIARIAGDSSAIDQPGFYDRLRDLIHEFSDSAAPGIIISIESSDSTHTAGR